MWGRGRGRRRTSWRGASAPRAAVALLVAAAFRLLAQAESFLDPGEYLSLACGAGRALDGVGAGLVVAGRQRRGWRRVMSLGPPGMAVAGGAARVGDLPLTGHATGCALRTGVRRGPSRCARLCRRVCGSARSAVALFSWRRSDPPERSGRRHVRLARLIERFSPIALASAAMVVASGAAEAIGLVGSLRALRETAYGQRLLLKLGAAGGVAGGRARTTGGW